MPESSALKNIQTALKEVGSKQVAKTEWTCPSHDDNSASLTVKLGDKPGHVLVRCAVCGTKPVLKKLGRKTSDLFDSPTNCKAITYDYRDAKGVRLYRVIRKQPKGFFQSRWDAKNQTWVKGLGDVETVLWNLPKLSDAIKSGKTVHLTEGEKDAQALNKHFKKNEVSEFATCHSGGAGKWQPQHTASLAGAARVVIWADRDTPGYRCALARFSALTQASIPAEIRLPIPNVKGADVFDHLAAKHTPKDGITVSEADLGKLISASEDDERVLQAIQEMFLAGEDTASDHLDDVFSDDDVLAKDDPQYVVKDWVPRGLYTVLFGPPGVRKTFALLGMSRAVRRGTRWQDHRTEKGAVLFYQGEGLTQLKPRIEAWDSRYPQRKNQTLSPGGFLERFVDLTKPEGVSAVIRTVRGFEKRENCKVSMVVIDPLIEFMTGDENGDGMDKVTRGLRALAAYLDVAVVVGHHTNASGERARGADFHKMRAGAFIAMEDLSDEQVGLWQQKQKNGERLAVILEPIEHKDSLVLEWVENLPVSGYVMLKESGKKKQKNETKLNAEATKRKQVAALLDQIVVENPGISQKKLLAKAKGNGDGFGEDSLLGVLGSLTDPQSVGSIRIQKGARGAHLHYPVSDE